MRVFRLNWAKTAKYCEKLAAKIDFRPDILVGLSRGGLVPARILADCLDLRHVFVLGISLYEGMGNRSSRSRMIQDLHPSIIRGKSILLVDDVADSGKSLAVARDYLYRKGARKVKIASIHYKHGSSVRPDYFVATTRAWVVYPWEAHEFEKEQ